MNSLKIAGLKSIGFLCSIVLSILLSSPLSHAIDAVDADFQDATQRERFQQLAFELRCPKCQNQNLIDSDSPISKDLRREIARLILEGKSDDEIKKEMVGLYGDFILYNPPVQTNTMILWIGPVIMVGIGLGIFIIILLQRSRAQSQGGVEEEDDTDDEFETDIDADIEADLDAQQENKESENSSSSESDTELAQEESKKED